MLKLTTTVPLTLEGSSFASRQLTGPLDVLQIPVLVGVLLFYSVLRMHRTVVYVSFVQYFASRCIKGLHVQLVKFAL